MSNTNKPGAPPPDDFSKTTPNISVPDNTGGGGDWNKTNYKMPRQPPPDEWGKTVANIRPIDTNNDDFGKTFLPGSKSPSTPEWGMTEARVNVAGADFGTNPDDFGPAPGQGYDKTTPYFRLPEAERAKYQELPPTPSQQAEQEAQEKKERGGIPGWFWALAGLLLMFFFAIIVLAIVYFIIIRPVGYEATLKGAPPGSSVWVNGSPWGVTDMGGTIKLTNLKEGETKKVEIVNNLWDCQPMEVRSQNGVVTPNPLIAQCKQKDTKTANVGDCGTFQPGEFDKAEICYNKALDDLPDPYTADQLVKALSILIINFDSGKYDVPPARLSALQKGAGFIKKLEDRDPSVVIEVGGHTDNVGNDASNQTLSDNRAKAVYDILVKFGVNPAGLQTRGYGETQPKFPNDDAQHQFLNRRIEYRVVAVPKKNP